jgi:hypothetical protein
MDKTTRCPYCGSYDTERHWGDELLKTGAKFVGGFLEGYLWGGDGELSENYSDKVVDSFVQNYTCNHCHKNFSIDTGTSSPKTSFVSNQSYSQNHRTTTTSGAKFPDRNNSANPTFSNPRQKKFYRELLPLSKERGGFTFNDIQLIKNLSKSFGLNLSELHGVAVACMWKNGRKPSINDFSNLKFTADESFEALRESSSCNTVSEKKIIQPTSKINSQSKPQRPIKNNTTTSAVSTSVDTIATEKEYLEEFKSCNADGAISNRERHLLDRLAIALGISSERQKQLEQSAVAPPLSKEEQEYLEEVKVCLMDDGAITNRERRLLSRIGSSLGLSDDQMRQIEKLAIQ